MRVITPLILYIHRNKNLQVISGRNSYIKSEPLQISHVFLYLIFCIDLLLLLEIGLGYFNPNNLNSFIYKYFNNYSCYTYL